MADSRDSAIREAKRFVRDVVRNDWEFTTDPDGKTYTALPPPEGTIDTLYPNRAVSEWRCREFDSTGSELEPQSSDQDSDYDSPNASDDPVLDLRRRRRRQMEDEMGWNEGLRMWMARRDVWSGARTRRQLHGKDKNRGLTKTQTEKSSQSAVTSSDSGLDAGHAPRPPCAGSSPHSDRQSQNGTTDESALATKTESSLSIAERVKSEEKRQRQDQDEGQSTAPDDEKRKESTETSITEPDPQAAGTGPALTKFPTIDDDDEQESDEELDEILIPVAPPFISSDNPVRATITPTIYPSIYSKVVVQGMTPTVPVNLADLTKAMVQGWKSDGQWPPKPAVTSIVLADDASVPKKSSDSNGNSQSRRKNSITNAMRKVFHLPSNPFHRRPSASQDAGNGSTTGNSGAII